MLSTLRQTLESFLTTNGTDERWDCVDQLECSHPIEREIWTEVEDGTHVECACGAYLRFDRD